MISDYNYSNVSDQWLHLLESLSWLDVILPKSAGVGLLGRRVHVHVVTSCDCSHPPDFRSLVSVRRTVRARLRLSLTRIAHCWSQTSRISIRFPVPSRRLTFLSNLGSAAVRCSSYSVHGRLVWIPVIEYLAFVIKVTYKLDEITSSTLTWG